LFSGIIVRCILAASILEDGKNVAKAGMSAVATHREEFEFDRGPTMNAAPNDIITRLEGYSGIQLRDAFALADLDREIKWHNKYARQNGIHVSPTLMIDGLVHADMSSGDAVSDWASRLLN
jgi:hypothetical protein